MTTCVDRLSDEEKEKLALAHRDRTSDLAKLLYDAELCPVCAVKVMIKGCVYHMKMNSNMTIGDFVDIAMEAISELYGAEYVRGVGEDTRVLVDLIDMPKSKPH